ncbi:hypothetical protein KEM56_000485, partial [Ascosphaera pollenicola]
MSEFIENIKEKFHSGEDAEGGSHDHVYGWGPTNGSCGRPRMACVFAILHVAGAALAGVAVGAAGLYAGEKLHESWEDNKEDIKEDVRDFPENAAEWTGEK